MAKKIGFFRRLVAAAILIMAPEPLESPLDAIRPRGRKCCPNECRNMNGGCENCGDPCL